MACDINFAKVGLLLLCDAEQPNPPPPSYAAFTPIDSSLNALVINPGQLTSTVVSGVGPFGEPAIDLANPPGSSTPGYFFSTTTIAANGPLDCSAGDYTVEGWFNIHDGSDSIFLAVGANTGLNITIFGGILYVYGDSLAGGNTGIAISNNTWYHLAMVMNGATNRFTSYLQGVNTGQNVLVTRTSWAGNSFVIGTIAGGSIRFPGFISNIRVTKGVQRYTSNFAPPSAPFPTIVCGPAIVPNIVGEVLATAETDIVAGGFIVGIVTTAGSLTVPAGSVISQNPAGGTIATQGSAVDLVNSIGAFVSIPDLTNTSVAVVAPALLAVVELFIGTITYEASGTIIAGNIIRQSPVAGTVVAAHSAINVVVSSGLPALRVPDIFGLSQADAILAIISLGLVVGAISSAPSQFVPSGTVQAQNPSAGIPVAVGSVVSFVLSLGTPAVGTMFDFEATVISQYANSPTILQLVQNLNQYIDQSANFANFFNFVWNVDTAVGFGLNIWGKIVGVSRLLQIPNTTNYVGFDNGTRSPPDWQSMGSDQPPQPAVGGAMYTGFNATSTYILGDDAYRQLILAKAFANIAATTAPAINTILQNLYGKGTAWVLNTGPMAISYNLSFKPSAIQLAILEQSGIIPTPPGVSVTIVVPP